MTGSHEVDSSILFSSTKKTKGLREISVALFYLIVIQFFRFFF